MFLKKLFSFVPKDDYAAALDLFNKGEYRRVLKKFEALLEGGGDDELDVATIELFACESRVALSREWSNQGKIEQAIEEMEQAVALKPNFADLRYNLGSLYAGEERYEDAKECFERALGINPKFFKARVNLAKTLHALGDAEEASMTLDVAKSHCPTFYKESLTDLIQMLRMNVDQSAIGRTFHEILEERPSSAQISREIAIDAIQNGNDEEAIRELKKAIALKPDYPDLHNYLGIAYGNSGMSDDAIMEFEVALKINPYYLKARLNLALALHDCGRHAEAESHLERVLSVQPENQLAKNLLAELDTVKGRR